MKLRSDFNKKPFIRVKGRENSAVAGWKEISERINSELSLIEKKTRFLVVETYQGILYDEVLAKLIEILNPDTSLDMKRLMYNEPYIRELTQPDVTDDRVFGYMTRLRMENFLDTEAFEDQMNMIKSLEGMVLIYGYGASIFCPDPDLLVYADMARWEIQLRMRANMVDNLGISNREEATEIQYKRGFFVDWRVCDRLKKESYDKWDYVLDTNNHAIPKLVTAEAIKEGLRQSVTQPFSLVPFFDPGPWGGHWMKDIFKLDPDKDNYAWCFNCVPEENSMLLRINDIDIEIPSINLVFFQPRKLLGQAVHARFGAEFPIRFDFLDTMEGGNLSLQVHPLTEYIQETFGMHYTQDESYYLMDASEDASVYLGLKEGVDREKMSEELKIAERDGTEFHAEHYVEKWPAKKHDHFLIPGGTVHCSGKNGMVLEISATPYIFTFKLYDWGRLNLDGKPRPININHGLKNIQWYRTTNWTKENLVNKIEKVGEGDKWIEEKTGLHEREFIETRRHWFTGKVDHDTKGGVNVLTLVEGEEVIIESPDNGFDPFVVHYAETFIVPANVGAYSIKPYGPSEGKECATIKAYVRTNP